MWERIRLIEAKQRLAWIHLTYRLPPRSVAAALTAGSLVVLLIPGPGATRAGCRLRGFARPAAAALALILLGSAAAGQGPALASLPRWAWLAAPWLLIPPSLRWTSPAPAAPPDVRHARDVAPRRAMPVWSTLRRLLPNVLLLVLSVTATLAVCELVTRRMFPWPALHPLGFNRLGFREREFPLEKPAGTYRVAVIGDSFTDAGAAIPEASRYTNRLEQLLNAGGGAPRFEVLSFGKGGHELVDHVETLRDLVLDIDPDFVLVQWYVNDFEERDKTQRPGPRALLPIARLHQLLLANSAFYNLLQRQWVALQEALGLVESYTAYMRRRFGRADSVGAREFASNLSEFVALAARRSVPVGMVLFPHVGPALKHDYPFEPLHRLVLEACAAVRIECLDLYPALAAHPDYRELMVTSLDPHPSELAHRLAAERILKAFAPAWGLRRE